MVPVRILLVDDYTPDVKLTQRAFRKARIANHLEVVSDGVEALDYLHQRGAFDEAERPDLILLDLNMPRIDGWGVLAEMQKDDELRKIPVIVLTTSNQGPHVESAYKLGANAYLVKPVTFEAFLETVKAIEEFWFTLVVLP